MAEFDDEELDDLPEVEMGVNREAFEHHCCADEAIDVEMDGCEIRCSADFPAQDSEGVNDIAWEAAETVP
jgi:hypothetical protein